MYNTLRWDKYGKIVILNNLLNADFLIHTQLFTFRIHIHTHFIIYTQNLKKIK